MSKPCKVFDMGNLEDHIFCNHECATNWVVVNEYELSDIDELDPTNEEDRQFILEMRSRCFQCERTITHD